MTYLSRTDVTSGIESPLQRLYDSKRIIAQLLVQIHLGHSQRGLRPKTKREDQSGNAQELNLLAARYLLRAPLHFATRLAKVT